MEKQLSAPGFGDWYAGLQRNTGAKARLDKYLPEAARNNLSDIYQVARGMREATKEKITTGRIVALQKEFAQPGGMLSKLWDGGKAAAAAEGVTSSLGVPGVGAASVIASKLSREKTPLTQAADQLLASPEFKAAVNKVMAESGNMTGAAPAAEKALTSTPAYKAWLKSADPAAREVIGNTGFLMWLTSPSREEPTQSTETAQQRPNP
jgi:hypothetical protein